MADEKPEKKPTEYHVFPVQKPLATIAAAGAKKALDVLAEDGHVDVPGKYMVVPVSNATILEATPKVKKSIEVQELTLGDLLWPADGVADGHSVAVPQPLVLKEPS